MAPGTSQDYHSDDWKDALVVVEFGVVELEGTTGTRHPFAIGSVLCLGDLPLRALHNPGTDLLVLALISRISSERCSG